jgi:hypothetical protein
LFNDRPAYKFSAMFLLSLELLRTVHEPESCVCVLGRLSTLSLQLRSLKRPEVEAELA